MKKIWACFPNLKNNMGGGAVTDSQKDNKAASGTGKIDRQGLNGKNRNSLSIIVSPGEARRINYHPTQPLFGGINLNGLSTRNEVKAPNKTKKARKVSGLLNYIILFYTYPCLNRLATSSQFTTFHQFSIYSARRF